MSLLKKLFKQTFIYGLATVLPRMISFLLVRLHTDVMHPDFYGELAVIFAWFAMFNVVLAYGMETAFFRFYTKEQDKDSVLSTSLISVLCTTLAFTVIALLFKNTVAGILSIQPHYLKYVVAILSLDALVLIPFAWLRAKERPMRYAIIKILNVVVNMGLNLFFLLWLPKLAVQYPDGVFASWYVPHFQVSYIILSNVVASAITLLLMVKPYIICTYTFDKALWRKMMKYATPVLIAGIAYTINEVFDRIMLEKLLPEDIASKKVGMYNACVKLALFMTLFSTAFRMGIEPFFFSHSNAENPQRTYAQITNYFVILGSVIVLGVVVYADVLKELFVSNPEYWDAMSIVPLIVIAAFFLGIYHNLSVWYKVTDRTKYGAFISLIGAVLTLIINYTLIPYIDYWASAIATVVAYGSMMLLSFYLGRKYYPIPYNLRKILFYFTLSLGFSLLSFYVFKRNLIIGSILFLVFLGVLYKMESDTLKKIFLRNGN